MLAVSLERSLDPDEKASWLRFLPLRLQRNNENSRISGTTSVRRRASGTLVVLAVFPKSANCTVIDCSIFGSRAPKPAEVEELKMKTSLEIDRLIVKIQGFQDRGVTFPLAVSAAQQAQINELLETHLDAERRLGAEIHPAARSQNFTSEGKADDDCKSSLPISCPAYNLRAPVCKELGSGGNSICSANAKGLLDW
jgi:hypothetical protein